MGGFELQVLQNFPAWLAVSAATYRVEQKKAAKLSEFSLNFPKLADWLCMGWPVFQAAPKAEIQTGVNLFCTSLYLRHQITYFGLRVELERKGRSVAQIPSQTFSRH